MSLRLTPKPTLLKTVGRSAVYMYNRLRSDFDKPFVNSHQYSDARRQSGVSSSQALAQPRGNPRSSARKIPPTGYIAGTHCSACWETKKRLVKHSSSDCPSKRSSAPQHERAYFATIPYELCYTAVAAANVEYVPNGRKTPTHRVDLTRSIGLLVQLISPS